MRTSTHANTALFRSECAKHVIILDCVAAIENENGNTGHETIAPNPEMFEACYLRLTSWWQLRPTSLLPETAPSQENLLCAYVTSSLDMNHSN
jgi:hypothetical protein